MKTFYHPPLCQGSVYTYGSEWNGHHLGLAAGDFIQRRNSEYE